MSFYNLYGQIYGQCKFLTLDLPGFESRFADYTHLRKKFVVFVFNIKRNESMEL